MALIKNLSRPILTIKTLEDAVAYYKFDDPKTDATNVTPFTPKSGKLHFLNNETGELVEVGTKYYGPIIKA